MIKNLFGNIQIMVMKLKRKSSIRIPKVLVEKTNFIRNSSDHLSSIGSSLIEDNGSFADEINQENIPPISSRLRSRNINEKATTNLKRSATCLGKMSLVNGIIEKKPRQSNASRNKLNVKKIPNEFSNISFQTPQSTKKVTRTKSVLLTSEPLEIITNTRYPLRSRSILKIPEKSNAPKQIDTISNTSHNQIFVTPQTPPVFKTPSSELNVKRHSTPKKNPDYEDLNTSQLSELSNISTGSVSATLLSRFVKKKSKIKTDTGIGKLKRKFELSQESIDTSSCASIGEESVSASLATLNPTQKILELCNQNVVKSWNEFMSDSCNKTVNKIGEGVYGEVFRLHKGNVLKVFPVDGDMLANGEQQMTMDDVFPELFVSRKLTELNSNGNSYRAQNYVQLKRASLLQGKLPSSLITHWNNYKDTKGTDNELLDFLPHNQHWIALEYSYAGEPLPQHKFTSRAQVRCVIEQIALSLAVAESALQFEHRDLHWLNILVKSTKSKKINYKINNTNYHADCQGIFATIIDFTVSRMGVDNNTVYMDMSDCPEIFEGEGDYQFELYRMMKNDNRNNWREFHPRTNLYWIHYLIDKLLHETRYPRGLPDSRLHEHQLIQLYSRVLHYSSAQQLIEQDEYFSNCRSDHNKSPSPPVQLAPIPPPNPVKLRYNRNNYNNNNVSGTTADSRSYKSSNSLRSSTTICSDSARSIDNDEEDDEHTTNMSFEVADSECTDY